MFLLFQSVREIHLKMIGQNREEQESGKKYGWSTLMLQLLLINSECQTTTVRAYPGVFP